MSDAPAIAPQNSLEVNPSLSIPRGELDVRVSRSSGAGGQHVNKTSSRVEIFWNIERSPVLNEEQRERLRTKLSSRLTSDGSVRVVASDMRSQIRNREVAMKVLKSRLYERHMEEERKKQSAIEDKKMDIAWGSQIRSYVLHPYKMVKDHRTGFVLPSAEKTLDGELDGFIKAFLTCRITGEWARGGASDDV